uniref:Tubby C-terminal domain-containing protein n=1 Tax=Globisporangium ultimum (strain ATCC 200006 / CBS 805.95 / DAOM BR144) TaxID=431595 RepID=K3WSK5_GLOUD
MGNQLTCVDINRVLLTPLERPLSVVGDAVAVESYCKPHAVSLQIMAQFTFPNKFVVRDASTGAVCFRREKTHILSNRQTLVRIDGNDVAPVANSKKTLFSPTHAIHVFPGTSHHGAELFQTLRIKMSFSFTEVHAEFTDRASGQQCVIGIEGIWSRHHAYFWLDRGLTGARDPIANVWVYDTQHRGKALYTLEIAPNVDAALLVILCMVLDERWMRIENSSGYT